MSDTELDRVMGYAGSALSFLKRFGVPPYPIYFELFFLYATGANAPLNARINRILTEGGTLSADDAAEMCAEFLNISDMDSRLHSMSKAVTQKISDMNLAIDAALATAHAYGGSLERASGDLGRSLEREQVRTLSTQLLGETLNMQEVNRRLEDKLANSREEMATLQADLDHMRRESLTDPLTRIPNRKCFDERLQDEIAYAQVNGTSLSLIVFDIDRFKAFNDTYGHLTGDQVLRLVAEVLRANIRGRDLPARFGGEEFVAILPETELDGALAVAENVRRSLQGKELLKRSTNEKLGRVTISAGVARLRTEDNFASLIERADQALYFAKGHGRNCVSSERDLVSNVA